MRCKFIFVYIEVFPVTNFCDFVKSHIEEEWGNASPIPVKRHFLLSLQQTPLI